MARLPLALVAAAPLFYLSWTFFLAWRQPLLPASRPVVEGVYLVFFMEGFMIFATLFIYSLVFVERRFIRVLWLLGISAPFAAGLYVFALGLERPDIGALYVVIIAARTASAALARREEADRFAVRWNAGTFSLILVAAVAGPYFGKGALQYVATFALYYLVLALWEVGFALWPAKPAKMAG